MKRLLMTLITVVLLSGTAEAGVSSDNQAKISSVLSSIGLNSMWSQDISLWIQGSRYTRYELEGIGHQICASTRSVGGYVITFWHQFGSGKITKVSCY